MKRIILAMAAAWVLSGAVFCEGVWGQTADYFYNIYKEIHQNPELSLQERETSRLIAQEMRKLGLEVTENVGKYGVENAGGYGVVGVLRNGKGPVVMLRADMDALPIKEATGLEFASCKMVESAGAQTPVMHACGHDMHSTILLGTLAALVKDKKSWKGTIVAVAQPAEELGRGAKGLLADGLLSRFPCPDVAIGWHVAPEIPAGTIGYTKGPALAGVRDYDITFYGKGAHGAFPHDGIDPILMAATAVLEYQTIIARNVIAREPAVLTVGAFNGGSRPNIIPSQVDLQITTRYFNEEIGDLIERRIREISNSTAQAFGMDRMPDIRIHDQLPPVINDIPLQEEALEAIGKAIGSENIIELPIHMVAEDFAFYRTAIAAQKGSETPAPTALFWIGASKSYSDISGTLHSPTFHPEFFPAYETAVKAVVAACLARLDI